MTEADIDAVRDWLRRLPGGSLDDRYGGDWDTFTTLDKPAVTLFGAYDTGKSSLLRRLIVDTGGTVPDWLTISARHETFDVDSTEIAGCTVRDTPGFTAGASDLRARTNTGRALAAVGLTDIGVAVLTSQLATAERDLLRQLIARDWPAGALWFVISRFDEAGADPEYDLDGYRELADRKVRELRELFGLDERTPVFVVAQDPYQTGGPETDLDRTAWDAFRSWDGMAALSGAIEAVSPAGLPTWRAAAGRRYWTAALTETLAELREQLADFTAQAAVAARGTERRDGWLTELGTLDRAAQAALEGLVDEVLRRPRDTGGDLQAELKHTLDTWFTRHESRLQRLRESIRKTRDRERAQPSWTGFATLVTSLETADEPGPTRTAVAGHVETVGTMLFGLLKVASDNARGKSKVAKAIGVAGAHLGTVEAALPLVVYLAGLYDDHRTDGARRTDDQAAAARRQQAAAECTGLAREIWQPYVDEVRDLILTETADQADLDTGLRDLVTHLQEAVATGERLRGPAS
ncbi:MAG TPA: GTPase domain-containing protein [Actinoplanes sp.]|nr:GTPase domain-containing protein [Actinoplanes sp.]